MNELLKALKNTLDKISVSGKENINKMMACFAAIDQLIAETEVQNGSDHHE